MKLPKRHTIWDGGSTCQQIKMTFDSSIQYMATMVWCESNAA